MSALPADDFVLDRGTSSDSTTAEAILKVNGCQIGLSVRQVPEGWQTELDFCRDRRFAWKFTPPPLALTDTQGTMSSADKRPLLIVHGDLLFTSTKTSRIAVFQLPCLSNEVVLPMG